MLKRVLLPVLLLLLLFSLGQAEELSPLLENGGILQLVNKKHVLDKSYAPDDLIQPQVDTRKESLKDSIYMRPEAAAALEEMFMSAIRESNVKLLAVSGYRAYGIQQILFNRKASAVGAQKANLTVARAGQSEHQTGLAMDVQCSDTPTLSSDFGKTREGQWVAENAHRFGYIVRYKAEWVDATGYAFEPWHIRYIGIPHATAVHMLDIPYETYYEYMIKLPAYAIERGNAYLLAGAVQDLMNGDKSVLSILEVASADEGAALEAATARYLPEEISYQEAVWQVYPTPAPTLAPRVDTDVGEIDPRSLYGGV